MTKLNQLKELISELDNGEGYKIFQFLTDKDFANMKNIIHTQLIETLKNNIKNKTIINRVYKTRLENYHQLSNLIDHSKFWNKKKRILKVNDVEKVQQMDFFKKLKNLFGDFFVADEEQLGYPNYYWRLVRPNEKNDIGPLHRDEWFWILNPNWLPKKGLFKRFKVWIPIVTEVGLNGLLIEKSSQLREDIQWVGEFRDEIQKPKLLTKSENLNAELVNINLKELIIFDDKLLHGGALNKGSLTRVNLEFTILKKESL